MTLDDMVARLKSPISEYRGATQVAYDDKHSWIYVRFSSYSPEGTRAQRFAVPRDQATELCAQFNALTKATRRLLY